MSSSLEELLAEEGFRRAQTMMRSRASFRSDPVSKPLYPLQDQRHSGSKVRTGRTRSNVTRNNMRIELPRGDSSLGRTPSDYVVRRAKMDGTSSDSRERYKQTGSYDMQDNNNSNVDSLTDIPGNEIVEVGSEEDGRYKDIYSNDVHGSTRGKDTYSAGVGEKVVHKESSRKDIELSRRHSNSSTKSISRHASFNDNRKSMKQPDTSYNRLYNRNFGGDRIQKHDDTIDAVDEFDLDKVAIKAMVSILCSYIKRFLKDEDFRAALRHNSFSSLNFVESEDDQSSESTVIANLEQAIEIVEKAVEESASDRDIKKASLQLSVITSLNLNELKNGFTSGIPNSKLSACAHLYLSIIYKLQKKDRISAKHILQVFCDSPSQARTVLLPDLWDHLFFPHLSHLKVWYDQEAEHLPDTQTKPRKLTLLNKVYNQILDSGTYKFAVYYKVWLSEGVEAPCVPSICIPSITVHGVQHAGSSGHSSELGSPAGPYSPKPMVSKKLYDAVFGRSSKPGVDEAEDDWEAENFDNFVVSSSGSTAEVKHTLPYSSETANIKDRGIEDVSSQINTILPESELLMAEKEQWRPHGVSVPLESDIDCEYAKIFHETRDNMHIIHASPNMKANELVVRSIAKSFFEPQRTEKSIGLTAFALSQCSEELIPEHFDHSFTTNPSFEESNRCYEYLDGGSYFSIIPQDFICPLTGRLFEDPVTLETGQTFEHVAVGKWFDQGHRTCPVTGNFLERPSMPLTNFVLKRVVDSWKTERCRHLLAFVSQTARSSGSGQGLEQKGETMIFILEQLLTAFGKEETLANVRHLISLGGLQFIIRMFEHENLEARTRISVLLCCCMEADAGSRNQIAANINKQCLLELLHSHQVTSRTSAVLLLIEVICLNRSKDITSYLSSLRNEQRVNTLRILLSHLQNSPHDQRPLLAVLLLHLDLLTEHQKHSIYRAEAVNAITLALEGSLTDEKVRESCCKALLVLGGRFSNSGELLTESWVLKQSGFDGGCEVNSLNNEDDDLQVDDTSLLDSEEQTNDEWLAKVSLSLLSGGKRSFLDIISKCIGSGNLTLMKVCLTTVAWLTGALSSLPDANLQLYAVSTLFPQLKESLENDELVEHKVLASVSLLNLSKFPECRAKLKSMSSEIVEPLKKLTQVTWTARNLLATISGEDDDL